MDNCLNCNHPLQVDDKFCAKCGQKTRMVRLRFWAGLNELITNAFSFDSKVFVSLRELVLKPGLITQQYNAGMQARFIPPLRMYLTVSLVFFLTESLLTKLQEQQPWETYGKEVDTGSAVFDINEVDSTDGGFTLDLGGSSYGHWARWIKDHPQMAPDIALDSLGASPTGWNVFLYTQIYKIAFFEREEFNAYLESKTQLLIFLFLPLIALVLKWIYIRHSIYYFEHVVFALHLQTVLFLLALFQTLFDFFFGTDTLLWMLLLFAAYLLLALKRVYGQSWRKTALKFVVTNVVGLMTLGFFGGMLFLLLFVLF
jgi:hypothetical protein